MRRTRKSKGRVKEEWRKSKGRDRKKKRKGRGKGKNKAVSHTDHCWCKNLSFSLSFCYRSWILCVFLFFWLLGCQAPSLCRICAIMTTNTQRKIPKALNSRRTMEKSRTLDFKSLDTDHWHNQRYRLFSLFSFFEWRLNMVHVCSWEIMED